MKILINLNILKYPLTGIGYYTYHIICELLNRNVELKAIKNGKILDKKAIVELVGQYNSSISEQNSKKKLKRFLINTISKIYGTRYLKFFIENWRLTNSLKKLAREDYIYFEPCFLPFPYKGKIITVIHDLSFLIHPEYHPADRVNYLSGRLGDSIKDSSKIVVDSYAILNELYQYYPETRSKSDVLYLGVDPSFIPQQEKDCSTILNKFGLQYKGFILSVATIEPRKNLSRLVDAYLQLPENLRSCYPLVLVGDSGWKNNELFNKINTAQIIVTGYLSDNELKKIYASALLFVYPSLYEGFGLPIIESMASGAAVITSNCGAMAEVAGKAAYLVDPYSVKEITDACSKVLADSKFRDDLVQAGIKRANEFRWANTVDQLLKYMRE
ncbi:glycosyltransferase family 4 protein [Lonepinella sp. MS14437]|uniref:glycosyltransferase family 4 protein n=1 Tax=Lonepinella sp. MS14437 TaxID=3003620 RepID=UPI0036DC3A8A